MNRHVSFAVLLLTVLLCQTSSFAADEINEQNLIKVRANVHPGFQRIVLEGPEEVIATGTVKQDEKNISVKFSGHSFSLQSTRMIIPYQNNDDTVIFTLKDRGDIKVFSLDEPSRLVIDVYPVAEITVPGQKEQRNTKAPEQQKEENKAVPTRPEVKTAQLSSNITPLEQTGKKAATVTVKNSSDTHKGKEQIEEVPPETFKRIESSQDMAEIAEDGNGFITDDLRKTWDTLTKEKNPYKVIAELSAYKPKDPASLAVYHYIYGEALRLTGQYIQAIEQLRLAFIHANEGGLKELSLFRRAEAYNQFGFVYEARSNYRVFISNYPDSRHIQKAHLGLARSLSEIGEFDEAVEHYRKAGNTPEVLFNMANTLQKLGKVEEAKKAYRTALAVDVTYPERSPETFFLLAENLRMNGELDEAVKLLKTITAGPFRDNANVSLGLIEMERGRIDQAIQYFKNVAFSRNMKIKVASLFNMSLAYLKKGKVSESASILEEVRKNYPDSSLYNDALLVLSKLYREEGRLSEAVFLLKELVYGNHPPKEAFTELEQILTEKSTEADTAEGGVNFLDLWREVGQWMLDESRQEFLLRIADRLKPEGKPYLQLCSWMAENASGKTRMTAALNLADYYAELDNIQAADRYMEIVRETSREMKQKESSDIFLRIDARVSHAAGKNEDALKTLMSVKEFDRRDFKILGDIIIAIRGAGGNIQPALALYERTIKKTDGEPEDYIRLADIYYELNEEKALPYYRAAHEKDPGDEWAIYRIGTIVEMPETNEMFGKLQNGDSLVSRVAKAKLKEIDLLSKIDEVYQ